MGAQTERRIPLVVLAGILCIALLVSCEGAASSGEDVAKTAGAESAEALAVLPALGDTFDRAEEAMHAVAPDAKLLAVRTSDRVGIDAFPEWYYLYISKEKGLLYTVFTQGEEAYPAELSVSIYMQEQFDAIPAASEIAVDANEAFHTAASQLSDDQIVDGCSVYLMTYVTEDADPTEDAMKWYFTFSLASEDGDGPEGVLADDTAADDAAGESAGEEDIAREEGDSVGDADEASGDERLVVVAVDARTGEFLSIEEA